MAPNRSARREGTRRYETFRNGDAMEQDDETQRRADGPLTGLEQARDRLRSRQSADLEGRRAALLARREIIDRELGEVDAQIRALQDQSE